MPDTTLVKHEDGVKLTYGMQGKVAIEVHVYERTIEAATTKAFTALENCLKEAATKGFIVAMAEGPPSYTG